MAEKITARLVGSVGGAITKVADIELPADGWTGGTNRVWHRIVEIADASSSSKIDLQPTAAQLSLLQQTGIALTAENANGIFTVYVFGEKPSVDLTLQATVTEVIRSTASENTVISGNTVGSVLGPMLYPRSR